MEVEIPESLFESLKLILKYQNTLLLKEIAKEKGWKYSELKKEFLKDEDMEVLMKKYNKKQKKKKTIPVKEPPVNEVETVKEIEASNEIESEITNINKVETTKKEVTEPIKKKKKIKKVVNSIEIRCHKYIFDGEVFYVNVDNNNTYDKNLEFVGVMLGNGINFNADEKEN